MGVAAKISLYLIHQETGQRYPVVEEVVIGRSSGDICFTEDARLSSQHCRIVKTPQGLAVHDLGSHNGTYLDGVRLNPDKMYAFKANSSLSVGDQVFKLQEVNVGRRVIRRKKKKRKKPSKVLDFMMYTAGLLVIIAAAAFGKMIWDARQTAKDTPKLAGPILTPFQLVEKEKKAALDEYADLGKQHTAKKISDKELAEYIRQKLIPRLNAVQVKMTVIKPSSEFERRLLEANQKFVTQLIKQVSAMASFAETHNPEHGKQLDKISSEAEAAYREVQRIESLRYPAAQ